MLIDNKLTQKALKVFTDMFHKFAPDGKMAPKECAAYIEGATLSYCPLYDGRVNNFYTQYDQDKDRIITLDDFLKFYHDCLLDS